MPATSEEFIKSSEFLGGGRVEVWEKIQEKFIESNPDVLLGENQINQVIDTGAIGVGKSFGSIILNALYSLYFTKCFDDVRKLFGLDASTWLVCMVMSDGQLATELSLYRPIRELFISMPFVAQGKHIIYDTKKESELVLEGNMILTPQVAGSSGARKALATFFAGLDESNHQPVIRRSKKSEQGEQVYDQARLNYDTFLERTQSRFAKKAFSIYKVVVAGSARRNDSMVNKLMREIRENKIPNVKIYENKQYDIRPAHLYSGKVFDFCMGDEKYSPHVIRDDEEITADMKIEKVPVEYKSGALMNPTKCQRDVIGRPTDAIDSFIGNNEAVVEAFKESVKSIVFKNNVVLGIDADKDQYLVINEENLPSLEFRQNTPHWIHLDLSKSGCATGISMCYISHVEKLGNALKAHFRYPLCASVIPDNGLEIRNEKLRKFIYVLRDTYKYWIAGISFDSFNSIESIQELNDNGFCAAEISTAKDIE